jgi:hypothetical protein
MQNFIPNDTAMIGGLAGVNPSGTVTFNLFPTTNCTGTAIYTETDPVNGDGSYPTSNPTDLKALLTSKSLGPDTAGTYKWQVTYSGDANNAPNVGACGTEQFTVTNGS